MAQHPALVTFGTPYRGSVNAIDFLAHGMTKKLGPITLIDLTDLMRSFTSVHQLLPEYACVDAGSGLVHLNEVPPIEGIDPAKLDAALGFHRTIAERATAHADDDEYQRNRYAVHPIVGIRQKTSQSVQLRDGKVEVLATYDGVDTDGDGTVPMQSATPTEWIGKNLEMYASERHASLQNSDPVLVQVDGVLRDEPVHFRAPSLPLGLDIDDVYETGAPITLAVRATNPGSTSPRSSGITARGRRWRAGRARATATGGHSSCRRSRRAPTASRSRGSARVRPTRCTTCSSCSALRTRPRGRGPRRHALIAMMFGTSRRRATTLRRTTARAAQRRSTRAGRRASWRRSTRKRA